MTYAEMMSRWNAPLAVVAGPRPKPSDRLTASYLGADQDLLDRTKHVRLKNETMLEFHARTGLGAGQIRQMSRDEITRFCEVAEETRRRELKESHFVNEAVVAKMTPKPMPRKLNLNEAPGLTSMFVGM